MRSEKNILRELKIHKVEAIIKRMPGDCLGLVHNPADTKIIRLLAQNVGYSIIQKYEYAYSQNIPEQQLNSLPDTIIY